MNTISGKILKAMGWTLKGEFPKLKKSIVIIAPHTSFLDAIYGKLGLVETGVKHMFLSKKELFFFPMNLIMKKFGSIPVRGVKHQNAIYQVVNILNESEEMHVFIAPEGTRSKVTKWNKGFIYMAMKANVPIVAGYLDYKKKEVGIKGVIYKLDNINSVMSQVNELYADVTGKHPDLFALEEIKGAKDIDFAHTN